MSSRQAGRVTGHGLSRVVCDSSAGVVRAHNAVTQHSLEAHGVIAAELVACTLGQRRRVELRMDAVGAIARTAALLHHRLHMTGLQLRQLAATLNPIEARQET